MKKLVIQFAVIAVALGWAAPARTQLTVIDPAVLAEAIREVENSVRGLENQATQITHQIRMIELQAKALERVTDSDFWRLGRGRLSDQLRKMRSVVGGVQRIEGRATGIVERWNGLVAPVLERVGPDGEPAADGLTENAVMQQQILLMQDDLMAVVQDTIDAQAAVDEVLLVNDDVARYLEDSRDAQGQVRQLQNTNNLLGALSRQLTTIQTTTATAASMTATEIAVRNTAGALEEAAVTDYFRPSTLDPDNGTTFRPGGTDN